MRSVVVKPDKKLLTVFFPDGRDGRTFTLKVCNVLLVLFFSLCLDFSIAYHLVAIIFLIEQGETSEELQEWKTALENALAQAPSAAVVMGQNGILRNEIADSVEASFEQSTPVSYFCALHVFVL